MSKALISQVGQVLLIALALLGQPEAGLIAR